MTVMTMMKLMMIMMMRIIMVTTLGLRVLAGQMYPVFRSPSVV